ncbi:metal ABC transporter permease [Collinsella sp. zg1085]|uniref:metal ABC transporter permease n=1 Tax=Collinsella sp. zg1085 TaxID=2844380 RepID=UPI001C0DFA78|nr:metal ABC transporter permease [Collinsella sp. zg1085]QWT18168.1 metal ABC transporter permease [Collinsella sp. zg1085]
MQWAINQLISYLQFPFVQYALVVGVLIALCSSLLGTSLVLRRLSFIGDGLSHVAFGVLSLATVVHLTNSMLLTLPVTVACAVLLLGRGARAQVKGDAAITMLSVGALAFGYIVINLFSASANVAGDVCTTLFGSVSILTLSASDVIWCAMLSLMVVISFVVLYPKLLAASFDEDAARVSGIAIERLNFVMAIIIGVVIVVSMRLVGSLLVSALVVFPALSAMRVCKSFLGVTIFAAICSVLCALLGMLVSILAGTPVGPTIVSVDAAVFLLTSLVSVIGGLRA